jgi:hypothetical protein
MDEDWSDLVQKEILGPLGMNHTGTNCTDPSVCLLPLLLPLSSLPLLYLPLLTSLSLYPTSRSNQILIKILVFGR